MVLAVAHNRRDHTETAAIWIIMRIEDLSRPLRVVPTIVFLRSSEHRHVVLVFTGVRRNNVYSLISQNADEIHGETAEFWML